MPMTPTETRPPYLQEILDRGSHSARAKNRGATDTSPATPHDFYSIGLENEDMENMSYYDIRMKELEEFKEKAAHDDRRALEDGSLIDEYSDHTGRNVISVELANGYSYNVSFFKSKFFEYSVAQNGDLITKDKINGSTMHGTKVEGNRWYMDISKYKPAVTKTTNILLKDGFVGLHHHKDGRISVSRTKGYVESHSFFLKTEAGAILTCDSNGELTLADPQRLPKDISDQDKAAHNHYLQQPSVPLDALIAPPIPLDRVKQERDIAQVTLPLRALGLRIPLTGGEQNSPQTSRSAQTQRPASGGPHI